MREMLAWYWLQLLLPYLRSMRTATSTYSRNQLSGFHKNLIRHNNWTKKLANFNFNAGGAL
ncbi:BDM_1a_G0025910.mRNA.1.CDS.1 [Saccharomyces cerevisiae]|nr:BDM_1a_G0025910.mRNA.1.CDS.1 [Saccharomyces cerevisiae]CAI7167369.1 BDM_1a_G0025910.mRNA.1.CDS.1 [Saccharomyces cerevisiae]